MRKHKILLEALFPSLKQVQKTQSSEIELYNPIPGNNRGSSFILISIMLENINQVYKPY